MSHEIHILLILEMCKAKIHVTLCDWKQSQKWQLTKISELDVTQQTVKKSTDVQPKPINKVRP
jgi:hypothetical protein